MTVAAQGDELGRSSVSSARFLSVFTVQFMHAYYNADEGKCQDFSVVPTPSCATWMKQQGLIFRDRGNGFSIDVPSQRLPGLLGASSGQANQPALSFMLVLRNLGFVGITELPITTTPTQHNLYASNLSATADQRAPTPDRQAQALGAQDLYPVTGTTLNVQGCGEGTLTVTDATGAPILPRATVDLQPGQPSSVNLSSCPYGLYVLEAAPKTAYAGPPCVLLVPDRPRTFGLVTLLLRQPQGKGRGPGDPSAFPLHGDSLRPVNLRLMFAARQTYWNYYVVSQRGEGALLENLAITGGTTRFQRSPARLPSGEQATLFAAETPLPLQQRSSSHFSLTGQRRGGDGGRGNVSVTPLPTAPDSPVWPCADGDVLSGTSEIYVYV